MEIIELALTQGITPAILVILYLTIIKLIDSRKESKQTKISKQLADSVGEISSFIKNMTETIIDKDKEKCKIAIEDSMNSAGLRLVNFVTDTIIQNHLEENKENILTNINSIINSEYYTVYSSLSLYTINSIKVSSLMKIEWLNEIEKDIINIIFNNKLSDSDKISTFTHKINLRFQSYTTYLINKTFK